MTPELVSILGVGVTIVAVLVASAQRADKRFERLEGRLDRLDGWLDRLESRLSNLEQRHARLEGLLDGLREALFERAVR